MSHNSLDKVFPFSVHGRAKCYSSGFEMSDNLHEQNYMNLISGMSGLSNHFVILYNRYTVINTFICSICTDLL